MKMDRETVRQMSYLFEFNIHGDGRVKDGPQKGLIFWDLEFKNAIAALRFYEIALPHVVDLDIVNPISSLWQTTTVRMVTNQVDEVMQ
jgi:hypothetical protein